MSAGSTQGPGAPPPERRRLLGAFVALVAERGYAGLDPAVISERAGLPAAAFERHFADLLACFQQAWEELETTYLASLTAAYTELDSWRAQLRSGIAATLALIEANPDAARFLTVETLAAGEPERHRQRALAARLVELLEAATEHSAAGVAVPEDAPRFILAMVFDCIYRHLASGNERHLSAQLPQLMFLAVSPYLGGDAGLEELRSPAP